MKSFKQLYLVFAVISILLAGLIFWLVFKDSNSHYFKVLENHSLGGKDFLFYHDLDQNGYSEHFKMSNDNDRGRYVISITNNYAGIIEWLHYPEPLHPDWIYLADYNNDNYDDVFVFTQAADSLFLYCRNVKTKNSSLTRSFIMSVTKPNPHHVWDVELYIAGLLDVDGDKEKELVFSLGSGYSHLPRGIYIYDISEQRIIRSFEIGGKANPLFFYDLTGDGKQEIIAGTSATNNLINEKNIQYRDSTAYLFVLDQNLKPVFNPLSFGKFATGLGISTSPVYNKKFIAVYFGPEGEIRESGVINLINGKGEIFCQRKFEDRLGAIKVINRTNTSAQILAYNFKKNNFLKLDEQLEVFFEKKSNEGVLDIINAVVLGRDGNVIPPKKDCI